MATNDEKISLDMQLKISADELKHGIIDQEYIASTIRKMYKASAMNFFNSSNDYYLTNVYAQTEDEYLVPDNIDNITFSDYLNQFIRAMEYSAECLPSEDILSDNSVSQCEIDMKGFNIALFMCYFPCNNNNALSKDFMQFNYKAFKKVLKKEFGYDIVESVPVTAEYFSLHHINTDDIKILHIFNYYNSARFDNWRPWSSSITDYKVKVRNAYHLAEDCIILPLESAFRNIEREEFLNRKYYVQDQKSISLERR